MNYFLCSGYPIIDEPRGCLCVTRNEHGSILKKFIKLDKRRVLWIGALEIETLPKDVRFASVTFANRRKK